MIEFSNWNKIDIHIHSKKSNEVKPGDYVGNEYDAKKIIEILTSDSNKIGIFSITDHNCINDKLYKEVDELLNHDNYKNQINYIVGVELDIFDENIHPEVFHCLCFFDSKEIDLLKKSIDELFCFVELSKRNERSAYPDVSRIFQIFKKNEIHDILLIPHFNNKSKGLLANDGAIDNLNYLCFDAYEDSNNVVNINKSLKVYLESGYDNFPFVVFSDSHDITNYPKDKNGNLCESCYILSNIAFPFNSLKTAFQEPRLRITIDNVDSMRRRIVPDKYINEIILDGKKIKLSPYQNTIIGKFGSGKSLLVEKIKSGMSGLKDNSKYGEFFSENETFKLTVGMQQFDSIYETLASNKNLKKYEFVQQEEYSYKNYLSLLEAKALFERLNISHSYIKDKTFQFNVEKLNESFKKFNSSFNKIDGINNLNYEKAFSNEDFYSVNYIKSNTNYLKLELSLREHESNFDDLKSLKIDNAFVFTDCEMTKIDDLKEIIDVKLGKINFISESIYEEELVNLIDSYSCEYVNNNSKESKTKFLDDINNFVDDLLKVNIECNKFQTIYNMDLYNQTKKSVVTDLYGDYQIFAEYKDVGDYKEIISVLFREPNRKNSFLNSILDLLSKGDKLAHNKEISEFGALVQKYCNDINDTFKETKVTYDFLLNGHSLLKKSAGEKSALFIKLIFDLIENDLLHGNSVLLIFDQPESNIDNENIFKEITNKIKQFKLKYNNFQSLIVTHNANVGITADSENIIIAKEVVREGERKNFVYHSGCIENKEFIKGVCNILEGGTVAMEQRTVKYGINIIKKVVKNEL